ncbi:MAG: 4Fe-4S cluster-binding domain-containing protein [Anaerolineales bacterium]|nr:4Fe-4S cluster-binding domain-containing protein [Anaerolineales bacterium]
MSLHVHAIRHHQHQDGPGPRSVVWVSGCSIRCPGCINPHLWKRQPGTDTPVEAVLAALEPGRLGGDVGVTIVGGEPFEQDDLGALCAAIATHWPRVPGFPRLIIYTGYTLAQLRLNPNTLTTLAHIDVLVDGPYIVALASPDLGYRGSSNQRVWNLAAARAGAPPNSLPRSLEDDWDRPRITVTRDGALLPPTLARTLGLHTDRTRQCGQDERSS